MKKHIGALGIVLLTSLLGCGGSDSVPGAGPVTPATNVQTGPQSTQVGFSEEDFAADPTRRLDPGKNAVLFLEAPGTADPGVDSGTAGGDVVLLRVLASSTYTLTSTADLQSVELQDSLGRIVLQNEGSANLAPGEYRLALTAHPGAEQRPVFLAHTSGHITLAAHATGLDLSEISFQNRTFDNMSFEGARMNDASFDNCTFVMCNFTRAFLVGSTFTTCSLQDCNLTSMIAKKLTAEQLMVEQSQLDGSEWAGSDLCQSVFKNSNVSASGVSFAFADLSGVSALDCVWNNSDFGQANLSDAGLAGGSFVQSNFLAANISGADFLGADLSEATWIDGTVLPQNQVGPPSSP